MLEATEIVQRDAATKRVYHITTVMVGLCHEQANVDWVTDVRPMLLAAAAPGEARLTALGGG